MKGPMISAKRSVWLLQDGEPLPIDESPRLMRTGDLANRLITSGYSVVWWTSRFNHNLKRFRENPNSWCVVSDEFSIALLDGPGYKRNMSWQRIRHYRALAEQFTEISAALDPPTLILASYPSPELCDAGRNFARRHMIPFVIDIRDPWPDIFPDYLPTWMRWLLWPVLWYYRRIMRRVARDADSIVAVSAAMLGWGIEYAGRSVTAFDRVFHIGFGRHQHSRDISVSDEFTPDEPLTVLFATTCGQSYDGELLVDAARILESEGQTRIRFVLTGDGDMRPQWIARAAGLTNVHFTGWISHEELQAHFRSAHVGLVLLKGGIARFWLGNKIFEYLSASLAIVNNVAGEPAEIVDGFKLGLNVGPGNCAALADAMRHLAGNPALVRLYMENARRAFEGTFERDVIQAQYVSHLEELIRGEHGHGSVAHPDGSDRNREVRACPE